jgi:hypothetical protein
MKKNTKRLSLTLIILVILGLVSAGISSFLYFDFLKAGRAEYYGKSELVNGMVSSYPSFFESIFDDIFPSALNCSDSQLVCVQETRSKLDALSEETARSHQNNENTQYYIPSNQSQIYFITLLLDGQIAKLFFSGDLVIEQVDTREEKMVVDLLTGERKDLYGPYLDQEAFDEKKRRFYDPKPAYLKDLYSQMEIIVPYYSDSEIIGAIVYLHGE